VSPEWDDITVRREWHLPILGVLLALVAILIGRAVWTESDRMLERAKAEYTTCLHNAEQTWDPEAAVSQCEQDWRKAQDAYYVP
jgi:hypothetical protein